MTSETNILVVDDQPDLLGGIQLALEGAGYRVLTAQDGHIALEILRSESIDLILADIAMPEMNGYQLYEHVRAEPGWVRIPFIFLTARAMASDIRYGKTLGVDDYLTKPMKPEDLLAAVEGRLRRARDLAASAPALRQPERRPEEQRARPSDMLTLGALQVSPAQHRVWMGGQEVELPAREFKVLEYLARRAGDVISPSELVLMSHGLTTDDIEGGALLRPLVRSLRRRLGYDVGDTGCIENVRGVGYRLIPPAR